MFFHNSFVYVYIFSCTSQLLARGACDQVSALRDRSFDGNGKGTLKIS